MNDTLIVKGKTTLRNNISKSNDILVYYGIPTFVDIVSKRNRANMLNNLECSAVIFDAINQMSNSQEFVIEIPLELRQLINDGKAHFDDSLKSPGNYTPNIRIEGQKGIKGQAYITKRTNFDKFTGTLSSLAMMAMIQNVVVKLDDVCELAQDIIKGQQYSSISKVLGSFKTFVDYYPYFKTDEELQNFANIVNLEIQQGLTDIHQSLNNKIIKLLNAPKNSLQVFFGGLIRFENKSSKYQKIYEEFIYEMRLYTRLIVISDIILGCKGLPPEAIIKNHEPFNNYCRDFVTLDFVKNMSFLMNTSNIGLNEIIDFHDSIVNGTKLLQQSSMDVRLTQKEVKYINYFNYESKKFREDS